MRKPIYIFRNVHPLSVIKKGWLSTWFALDEKKAKKFLNDQERIDVHTAVHNVGTIGDRLNCTMILMTDGSLWGLACSISDRIFLRPVRP